MTTRREFLKRSAAAGALASVPYVWSSSYARAADLNSQPTIAAIGVGGPRGRYSQGGSIARAAASRGVMIAVCDVDDVNTADFNKSFDDKLNVYRDYRELFDKEKPDVVTIGTPDHWHVPIAIHALRAGCHVYCEKPLTLTIEEGFHIQKVVQETGKVFQVGTQQRSQYCGRFLKAIAIVQSGRLGKNVNAYLAIGGAPGEGLFDPVDVPEGLDWDLWLGPTPEVGYSEGRRKYFRWWLEYSGGKMTDWGAHHIDIAMWALGHDHSGPVKISGTGKFPPLIPDQFDWAAYLDGEATLPNVYNTPMTFGVNLEFTDGSIISVHDYYQRDDGRTKFPNGILFEGEAGRIFVNRERLSGRPVDELTQADHQELREQIRLLYNGKRPGSHMRNFFECLEDGQDPIADVYTHHRTMACCHLANIALMLGRDLEWDPDQEQFVGDSQATELMSRKPREKFAADALA